MKIVLAVAAALLAALLLINTAQAQRVFNQAELDAMLAPVALQPDPVVSSILIAATHPDEVVEAARWSRANRHMSGEDAVRAVENQPWHPSVKALVAFPDLLARMDESPRWLADLGEAFVHQQPHVMETVQALRRRARAAGHLESSQYQSVYHYGSAIVVQPPPEVVYVRYYDPYLVYGQWWWPHYRPIYWRPWVPRPVFFSHGFIHTKPHGHRHHIHHHQHHHNRVIVEPHLRVPEAQRRPIVQHAPPLHRAPLVHHGFHKQMPAASGFSQSEHKPGNPHQQSAGPRRHRG